MNNHTITIASDGKKYKPVMDNHFVLTVYGLDGMRDYSKTDENAVLTDAQLSLKIANQSFQEPNLAQGTTEIKKGNMSITFPTTINSMSSSMAFEVFVEASAYNVLYSWKMAAGNHVTGQVGNPQDYWKRVTVDITDGNKGTLYGTWTFDNAWISSLSGASLSNTSGQIKTVSVTLHYFRPRWEAATLS